jgi:hypothetical protein
LALKHKTNDELFALYEAELILKVHNPRNLENDRRLLAKFHSYLNGSQPSPELAKGFLSQFSGKKPGTLARYATTIKSFMKWYGEPTGSALTSNTFDGSTLTDNDDGLWKAIFLTPYELTAGTKYAIVCTEGANQTNWVCWREKSTGGYAFGNGLRSGDGGDNWTALSSDFMFEERGHP